MNHHYRCESASPEALAQLGQLLLHVAGLLQLTNAVAPDSRRRVFAEVRIDWFTVGEESDPDPVQRLPDPPAAE